MLARLQRQAIAFSRRLSIDRRQPLLLPCWQVREPIDKRHGVWSCRNPRFRLPVKICLPSQHRCTSWLGSTTINDRSSGGSPLAANTGSSRFSAIIPSFGGIEMERTGSASASVGGIEWVDWMDSYKRYKDEKIRAEAEAKRPPSSQQQSPTQNETATSSPVVPDSRNSPRELEVPTIETSAVALSPSTSRDDYVKSHTSRQRSLSIRSSLSGIGESRLSPTHKLSSMFDRPRQSSSGSNTSQQASSAGRKKINLVNKMEGWWSAVKSNFISEAQHAPSRPSNLGVYVQKRIPSAPSSRRASEMSPNTRPEPVFLAPEPIRRGSSHSIRAFASNVELRSPNKDSDASSLQQAAHITTSSSSELDRYMRHPIDAAATESIDDLSDANAEERTLLPPLIERHSGDSRRRQPDLRLDLESHVLTRSATANTSSSGSQQSWKRPPLLPQHVSDTTSQSSSFGRTLSGPGLTPGIPSWDHTPSPIIALSESRDPIKENRPIAPGTEITVASVRRHVKHRLNAAKAQCDQTLKKTIAAMTKFAEERRAEEEVLNDEDHDAVQDYFDAANGVSDSPLIDADNDEERGEEESKSRDGSSFFSLPVPTFAISRVEHNKRREAHECSFHIPWSESKRISLHACWLRPVESNPAHLGASASHESQQSAASDIRSATHLPGPRLGTNVSRPKSRDRSTSSYIDIQFPLDFSFTLAHALQPTASVISAGSARLQSGRGPHFPRCCSGAYCHCS